MREFDNDPLFKVDTRQVVRQASNEYLSDRPTQDASILNGGGNFSRVRNSHKIYNTLLNSEANQLRNSPDSSSRRLYNFKKQINMIPSSLYKYNSNLTFKALSKPENDAYSDKKDV